MSRDGVALASLLDMIAGDVVPTSVRLSDIRLPAGDALFLPILATGRLDSHTRPKREHLSHDFMPICSSGQRQRSLTAWQRSQGRGLGGGPKTLREGDEGDCDDDSIILSDDISPFRHMRRHSDAAGEHPGRGDGHRSQMMLIMRPVGRGDVEQPSINSVETSLNERLCGLSHDAERLTSYQYGVFTVGLKLKQDCHL